MTSGMEAPIMRNRRSIERSFGSEAYVVRNEGCHHLAERHSQDGGYHAAPGPAQLPGRTAGLGGPHTMISARSRTLASGDYA
jgi:hypothetical protein